MYLQVTWLEIEWLSTVVLSHLFTNCF